MTDAANAFFTFVKPVVLIYPNLKEARAVGTKDRPRGEPKFSADFLVDPADPQWNDLRQFVAQTVKGYKFKSGNTDLTTLKLPWADGTAKADKAKAKAERDGKSPYPADEAGRGLKRITARSKFRLNLSIFLNGKITELNTDELIAQHVQSKFYSGALVVPSFKVQPYDRLQDDTQDGVTLYPAAILSLGKDGKFGKLGGSAPTAAETFSGFAGGFSDENPLGNGSDDDLSF